MIFVNVIGKDKVEVYFIFNYVFFVLFGVYLGYYLV